MLAWTLDYRHLRVGQSYRVARAFRDHDGLDHPVGEGWLYVGHNVFAREQGLTLYVVQPKGTFGWLRLRLSDDEQGRIDAALAEHLVAGDVALDHDAFARELATCIGGDNALLRQMALELVSRMVPPPLVVAAAVIARLQSPIAGETVVLLMALYNVDARPYRHLIEALATSGDGARIQAAVLAKS